MSPEGSGTNGRERLVLFGMMQSWHCQIPDSTPVEGPEAKTPEAGMLEGLLWGWAQSVKEGGGD